METRCCTEFQDQFDALRSQYAAVTRGLGRVMMLDGPIGSGNVKLLRDFCAHATAEGALVLAAKCSRAEQALPFGVVSQLFHNDALPAGVAEEAYDLLGPHMLDAQDVGPGFARGPVIVQQGHARLVHRLVTLLLNLAQTRPLVIEIDDLQHADGASLGTVSYLQRRLRSTRTMLVLSGWNSPRPVHPLFDVELFRQSYSNHIRLGTLDLDQIADVARTVLGSCPAGFAESCLAVTGGGSLLLDGLLADTLAARSDVTGRDVARTGLTVPVAGHTFSRSVVTCIHSGEPELAEVAAGIAVLGTLSSVRRLVELTNLGVQSVDEALSALADSGLVLGVRFRAPVLRDIVLESTAPRRRMELNLRAARLLTREGAEAGVVAVHLLAAGDLVRDEPWAIEALCDSADQALLNDQVHHAIECLTVARSVCGEPRRRALVAARLIHLVWRINPSAAAQELVSSYQAGEFRHLIDDEVPILIGYLLWHGRFDEAAELLDLVDERAPRFAAQTAAELSIGCPWLLASRPEPSGVLSTSVGGLVDEQPVTRAITALTAALKNSDDDTAARIARQVIQGCRLDHATVTPVVVSLGALIVGDRLEEASRFCTLLWREASAQSASTWQAQLEVMAALIALRRGDLAEVERQVQTAMARMSPQSWGVLIGAPLSLRLLAASTAGRYREAEELLCQAVPQAMFDTIWGLLYLYARGAHRLATGHVYTARDDLLECGEKLVRWKLDLPALIPWRSAAAQAELALGRRDHARQLAEEQLRLVGPGPSRTRGISLRTLAGVSDLVRRPSLLRSSGEMLERCGDKLELAHTHTELSRACRALGDVDKAETFAWRAGELFDLCGVRRAVQETSLPQAVPGDEFTSLSNAERRVASLAAQGHTNREISQQLFITVSTVEQHLTRVYRKLNVHRRAHLPAELVLDAGESA
ncbi:DNA-binding CsgD family transcriptional regulator [Actinoalloteichus hoggarensis]|uniref:Oxygen regulatory protein NreC n=1 Tax=Actinoalloteichus hoggarensis TaxID=1470176 RepID=A0A221W4Y9_9PSEU|nr:LuxR family transcriptional regulator [Actinoalloteichus hoggarensis]ASO20721.1 Oxygen regulatory protein NreC [Actinoalloteichus hoggarensis]MBB5924425.1 DNA-binding CsgD family transcriptional regulator [Actinoalloteichus hoggarensis]